MTYDDWRFAVPEHGYGPGVEVGDGCNRYPSEDEDAPRGYRPRPCDGVMIEDGEDDEFLVCDTCGASEWNPRR